MSKLNLKGIVISNKMNKTLVVKIDRQVKHKKYKKVVKCFTKFFIHDENNKSRVGDIVSFKEVAPISKKKNWILCSIDKRGGGALNDSNAI